MSMNTSVNGTTYQRSASGLEKRSDGFLHARIDVGEVTLHVAQARPATVGATDVPRDVPLVVMLHGFPEYWWSWREQLRALAAAGFWAVAPDMRGYDESDKPEGVGAYDIDKLVGDVAGLIRALGREKAVVVGHDWGGFVAWHFAQQHPEMLDRLAILNIPHPLMMQRGLQTARQLRKSWYIFFFQLPGIPERLVARDDFAAVRKMFAADGLPREAIEHYVDAFRVPGAATSAINYYRAAMRRLVRWDVPKAKPIERPVLVLWGDRDRALGKELAEPPKRFVPNARVVHFPNATHWLQEDAPDEVNRRLVAFVREGLPPS